MGLNWGGPEHPGAPAYPSGQLCVQCSQGRWATHPGGRSLKSHETVSYQLNAFQSIADCLGRTTSDAGLTQMLLPHLSALGFDGFCFSSRVPRGENLVTGCDLTNWPIQKAEEYVANRLYEHDPVPLHIWSNFRPYVWRLATLPTCSGRDFRDFLGSTPVKSGIVVPTYLTEDSCSMLSLSRDACADLDPATIPETIFLASALTLRFQSPHRSADHSLEKIDRLSARQREILKWIVLGKSNADIATICDLTKRNVDYHVGTILRLLDTASRSQAAALYAASCRDW